jgi:hypothetical protein
MLVVVDICSTAMISETYRGPDEGPDEVGSSGAPDRGGSELCTGIALVKDDEVDVDLESSLRLSSTCTLLVETP